MDINQERFHLRIIIGAFILAVLLAGYAMTTAMRPACPDHETVVGTTAGKPD